MKYQRDGGIEQDFGGVVRVRAARDARRAERERADEVRLQGGEEAGFEPQLISWSLPLRAPSVPGFLHASARAMIAVTIAAMPKSQIFTPGRALASSRFTRSSRRLASCGCGRPRFEVGRLVASTPRARGRSRGPRSSMRQIQKARRLSFANLVELHVLSALRDKQVRVERIRSASNFICGELKVEHPLADVDAQTDRIDIYVEYLGRLINASSSNLTLRPLVERYLERIDRDEHGLASRLFPITRDDAECPRVILIDPARRFGRPVLESANIETLIIAERFLAGELPASLATDLQVSENDIFEAVRFESQLRAA